MTSTITVRVDAEKRRMAEEVFSQVGMTTSGAVNLFICAVAMNKGIPFPITTRPLAERSGLRLGLADGKYAFKSNAKDFFRACDEAGLSDFTLDRSDNVILQPKEYF